MQLFLIFSRTQYSAYPLHIWEADTITYHSLPILEAQIELRKRHSPMKARLEGESISF